MNVPHFSVGKYLCLVFVCSLVTLGFGCKVGGGGFLIVDWEGIVIQNVLDGGNFCIVIIFL